TSARRKAAGRTCAAPTGRRHIDFYLTLFFCHLQAPYKIRKNCAISADCDPVCYGNLKQKML
uniref:hypothetical protein n=1 Tax=Gemmiger formicilis TaxID=745368 RepID=UPI003FEDCCEE